MNDKFKIINIYYYDFVKRMSEMPDNLTYLYCVQILKCIKCSVKKENYVYKTYTPDDWQKLKIMDGINNNDGKF